jgi:hypothetical protein
MRRMVHRAALLLIALIVLSACAAPPAPSTRASSSPRVRCLSDPNETGTRPLFFLFCVESP